jgi:hypothetical protein
MSIYVEILIRSGIDDLWEKTQDPKLHQRWDLRLSEIDYLPRRPGQAQKFLYKTRIGGGLRIEGAGESTGERDDTSGQRTSALKFWSDDPKSLIKLGSGYWKYIPGSGGIRFITWYDYRTRFGIIGQITDRVFFVHCSAGPRHGASIASGFGSKKVSCLKSLAIGHSSMRCLA